MLYYSQIQVLLPLFRKDGTELSYTGVFKKGNEQNKTNKQNMLFLTNMKIANEPKTDLFFQLKQMNPHYQYCTLKINQTRVVLYQNNLLTVVVKFLNIYLLYIL